MTDTIDIKALRELLCHENKESDHHIGVTVTTLRLLLSKADQLEAERQRAAGSEEELHKALHREKAAERKLLAAQDSIGALEGVIARKDFDSLKGDQVPVAWRFKNESGEYRVSIEKKPNTYGRTDFEPLFTAPQKPVVLPEGFYPDGDIDCELVINLSDAIAAIEAAGGIVKDGE